MTPLCQKMEGLLKLMLQIELHIISFHLRLYTQELVGSTQHFGGSLEIFSTTCLFSKEVEGTIFQDAPKA